MDAPANVNGIATIAVIGAGQRGRAIALAALLAGYRIILEDVSREALEAAAAWLKTELEWALKREGTKQRVGEAAAANLVPAASLEGALREADLVIEAAAEEMEAKIELFTIFDKFAKADAILASSSPALPVGEMASVTFCPERCIGMRFGDSQLPTAIELVTTPATSEETIAAAREVVRRMGKLAVVVAEPSGGTGSQLQRGLRPVHKTSPGQAYEC